MIFEIRTFDDKSSLITCLTELAECGHFVFRGYNKQDQLLPNILRGNLVNEESALLFEFERSASQYLNANNPIDFMSYAQHYGLPTRLLDFTYNPFIALFFALFMPKGSNYAIPEDKDYYYIRYCDIETNIVIHHVPIFNRGDFFEISSMAKRCIELVDTVDMMFNKNHVFGDSSYLNRENAIGNFFSVIAKRTLYLNPDQYIYQNAEKIERQALFFIDPSQSNQRLIMQQGLFLFPYTLNKDEHIKLINSNTGLIKINKNIREELQSFLDTMGFNSYRLMPDLSSVCAAVERKIRDNRAKGESLFGKTSFNKTSAN